MTEKNLPNEIETLECWCGCTGQTLG